MLPKNKSIPGVNPDTSNKSVALLELSETVNGHTGSFKPGFSLSTDILEPSQTPDPVVLPMACDCATNELPTWPRKLPNRRGGFNQRLVVNGMKLYLRTGEFSDGTLGEIFIDTQKEGTFARAMLNQWAIAVSTGLQHGVPFQVFVDQFKNVMFEPKGEVTGSDSFTEASSIIDAVFRELEIAYPNGKAVLPASPRSVLKSK